VGWDLGLHGGEALREEVLLDSVLHLILYEKGFKLKPFW